MYNKSVIQMFATAIFCLWLILKWYSDEFIIITFNTIILESYSTYDYAGICSY